MIRTGLVVLTIVSMSAAAAGVANAQPSAPNAQAQAEADEHERRGFDAVKRGDAEAARLEYRESYTLAPSRKVLWNLLLAEIDSKHPLDALQHLNTYLTDPDLDPKRREQAKGLVTELKSKLGHLQIRGAEASAAVTVDGAAVTPEQRSNGIDVSPGKHAVEAALPEGTQRREVDAVAGKDTVVSFETVKAAAVGASPVAATETAPDRLGGIAPPPTATWILGGVGLAALGAGIGFSLSAKSKKDEIGDSPIGCAFPDSPACAHQHDLDDAGRRNSTIAWVAYGTAGAAFIAGGLFWIFSPKDKPATGRAQVAPLVSRETAGIRIQTAF